MIIVELLSITIIIAVTGICTFQLGSQSLLLALLDKFFLFVDLAKVLIIEYEDDDVREELRHRVTPNIDHRLFKVATTPKIMHLRGIVMLTIFQHEKNSKVSYCVYQVADRKQNECTYQEASLMLKVFLEHISAKKCVHQVNQNEIDYQKLNSQHKKKNHLF